jgi:hypothetical protein
VENIDNQYLKTKSSNWTLIFDNSERVELKYLSNESLSYLPNGIVEFILISRTIDDKLIALMKSRASLSELTQFEKCCSFDGCDNFIREVEHRFMNIFSVEVENIDGEEVMKMVLSNQ